MFAQVQTGAVYGIEASLVDIEVHVSSGGNSGDVQVVGLPDTAIRESRARVKAAMKAPVMIDLRNIYDPDEMVAAGFDYTCIGRPYQAPEN